MCTHIFLQHIHFEMKEFCYHETKRTMIKDAALQKHSSHFHYCISSAKRWGESTFQNNPEI